MSAGEILQLKETHQYDGRSIERVRRRGYARGAGVGTDGRLGGQAQVLGRGWHLERLDRQREFHGFGNLAGQVRNIAEVATAIANGDLSRKITVDVRGEILSVEGNA